MLDEGQSWQHPNHCKCGAALRSQLGLLPEGMGWTLGHTQINVLCTADTQQCGTPDLKTYLGPACLSISQCLPSSWRSVVWFPPPRKLGNNRVLKSKITNKKTQKSPQPPGKWLTNSTYDLSGMNGLRSVQPPERPWHFNPGPWKPRTCLYCRQRIFWARVTNSPPSCQSSHATVSSKPSLLARRNGVPSGEWVQEATSLHESRSGAQLVFHLGDTLSVLISISPVTLPTPLSSLSWLLLSVLPYHSTLHFIIIPLTPHVNIHNFFSENLWPQSQQIIDLFHSDQYL